MNLHTISQDNREDQSSFLDAGYLNPSNGTHIVSKSQYDSNNSAINKPAQSPSILNGYLKSMSQHNLYLQDETSNDARDNSPQIRLTGDLMKNSD